MLVNGKMRKIAQLYFDYIHYIFGYIVLNIKVL